MEQSFLDGVREVVVIVSSPRGGSSVLAEWLRGCSRLVHLPGETPPLLTLAGVDSLRLTGSEVLGAEHAEAFRAPLDEQFASEAGGPSSTVDEDRLGEWLYRRLCLQWPDVRFDQEFVRDCVREAARVVPLPADGSGFAALSGFQLEFIARIRARHPMVDPYYYDISEPEIVGRFPCLPVPSGPPGTSVVEVPPFLVARSWRLADPGEVSRFPLVVKAPGCSYQIEFYRALFPNARLRVLHLTRAPGSSVHGLEVAWHHRGFFSRRLAETLRIEGYSDLYDWGAHWWNFDLPPGWRAMIDEPLLGVCSFQWHSAHRAVLDSVGPGDDVLRLRHEDLIGPPPQRLAAVRALGDWLDLPGTDIDDLVALRVSPVSATDVPDDNRWLARRDRIEPFIGTAEVREIADALGYRLPVQKVRG